jgi:hypothetical protein
MKILAVGCSFTYGLELPDAPPSTFYIGKPASDFAYPALVAQTLGAELTNLSLPGGSNSRIFRLALDNSVKEKYDLIICGWTGLGRLDICYEDKDFPVTSQSKWLSKDFPWINEYYKNHYNLAHDYQVWITQLIALQNHFKLLNQRYIFLNMYQMLHTESKQFQHLTDMIDTTNYPGWPKLAMVDWMGDCAKGPGGHPLELGHQRIAERINEHIRHLGWLP